MVNVAPVLSQHVWSKPVVERFARSLVNHHQIIPKSYANPGHGIIPSFFRKYQSNHRGKTFPKLWAGCTPVTTCGGEKRKKKKTWYTGTTFWNGELLNIYSSSRERWWNIFVLCGWREDLKRVKNREIEAGNHESLSLNDKYKENGFHVCDHCTTEVCDQNSLFVFLLSFFPPLFWLKQIFSSLPKYTAVTSPNFQCL